MAFIHAKDTFISLNGANLSTFVNTSELSREADEHDITCYGATAHSFQGGLLNGKATMAGLYDSTAGTGPRAVIRPLIGTTAPLIRRTEGTGVGRPQDSAQVHVKTYVETNPVADMIAWSCEMTISGTVTSTTQ